MIFDILNVLGIFFILLSVISLIFLFIKFLLRKNFVIHKFLFVMFELLLGLVIIFIISLNNNYVNKNSVVYTNPDNTIPLSVNVVSGAKINYLYDKRYVYKFRHNGKDVFRLSPVMIKKNTKIKVIQKYRNNFLVPTVDINNVKIIKKLS